MTNPRVSALGWLAIALIVAVVLMGILGAAFMGAYGGTYGMMGGGGWSWGLAMMAIPGVILVVILLTALGGIGDGPPSTRYLAYAPPHANAVDILDQRYARGELSPDEYHRMRTDLSRGPVPPGT